MAITDLKLISIRPVSFVLTLGLVSSSFIIDLQTTHVNNIHSHIPFLILLFWCNSILLSAPQFGHFETASNKPCNIDDSMILLPFIGTTSPACKQPA